MALRLDDYSLMLIVSCMKLKLKMSVKILARIKKCLIIAIIHLSQNNTMTKKKLVLARSKMKQVVSLLKNLLDCSKMYSFLIA